MNIRHLLLIAALLVTTGGIHAEDVSQPAAAAVDPYAPISAWAVCPPQRARDYDLDYHGDPEQAPTHLSGDLAEHSAGGKLILIGNAEAQRGAQRLRAERITYSEAGGIAKAEGQVRYDEPTLSLSGSHGTLWMDKDYGEMYNTRFWFYDRHGRGKAKKAWLLEPGVTKFRNASYTTCPEGSNSWRVRGSKVTLDENTGVGVARNARLSVKGVPVLYAPYFSFPLDDRRKTGFLTPSFGSSDNSGIEIRTPFYLNLAPNYDATITPRYLEDRGTQLITDFRYLRPNQQGKISVEYLNKDDVTDDDRSRITLRDNTRFSSHLTTSIDYDRVSDKEYLQDLGDSLSLASVSFLKRTGVAEYTTSWWQLGLQVDDYQTLDRTIADENRPYQRLPRTTLLVASPIHPLGIHSNLRSEAVRFDASKRVTGDRIDLWPDIERPFRRSAYEITPRAGVRYTGYKLDSQDPGVSDSLNRTTPFASLDSTVFLERNLKIGSVQYTHTLEPRLFYLYVQGKNQDDIPQFDASEPTFSYRELFETNRFNGADRMGDANQAALAVTSRLLDPETGAEKLRASVGQLFYFANRNVTLNNSDPLTDNTSDIAGELEIALSRSWTGKADMVWNPRDQVTERANARIQYHPGFRKIANVSYRYINGSQNQIDTSILWPLSPSWHVLGRWYYDISDSQQLETLAGVEYDSCCWGIRFVTRDFVDTVNNRDSNKDIGDSKSNRIFMLQVVFKGLASFGSNIETLLQNGILGYTERPTE
ncbi:MAG TPA: LPS-assembly protein LptD [Gammaproteobacteria bacterium]|nr:LPS-assembly protein LptD [Gammaproteobacteria bacterium]